MHGENPFQRSHFVSLLFEISSYGDSCNRNIKFSTIYNATKLEILIWIPLPLGNQAIGGISIRGKYLRVELRLYL